jgi:hypothetical protein
MMHLRETLNKWIEFLTLPLFKIFLEKFDDIRQFGFSQFLIIEHLKREIFEVLRHL